MHRFSDGQLSVAVKKVDELSDEGVQEFMRTFEKVKAFKKSPNVIQLMAVARQGSSLRVYMPLCEGDLRSYLTDNDPDNDALLRIMREICEGLKHLHGLNVAHGNLKPSNVLYQSNGSFALTDIGLSVIYAKDEDTGDLFSTRITGDLFIAPEVLFKVLKRKFDDLEQIMMMKGDIFAFGSLIYWMIVKEAPFSKFDLINPHFELPSIVDDKTFNMHEIKLITKKMLERESDKRPLIENVHEKLNNISL